MRLWAKLSQSPSSFETPACADALAGSSDAATERPSFMPSARENETLHFAGQAEQEIRRHLRDRREVVATDDLEDRVRECFEVALERLGPRARRRERRAPRG